MATAHNFSAFANSLVRPPVDPKTGLASTLDERIFQQRNRSFYPNEHEEKAPKDDRRGYTDPVSEQVLPSNDVEYMSDDFYDALTSMKKENVKNLQVCENLYKQKLAERGNVSIPVKPALWNVDNFIEIQNALQFNRNKEALQRSVVMKDSRKGDTAARKPPSGKPKTSEGVPMKSGVNPTKVQSRSWADRVRASEPYWRAPLSRASSDFNITETGRSKGHAMSQTEPARPADDLWESYSFMDQEPRPLSKSGGKLRRSNSMSRLPTTKSDMIEGSDTGAWKKKLTVPEPFSMTLRDANKTSRKVKVAIEMEQKKAEKQLEEELECQKKFKATPPPAHTYLPLFQEIMEEQESKRRLCREQSLELVKSLQQPFEFMIREEEKESQKKTENTSVNGNTSHAKFKANPFPAHIFDDSTTSKMAAEEEYRRVKAKLRAKELIKSARLPSSMDERDKDYFKAKSRQKERSQKALKSLLATEPSFHPKVHKSVPDLDEKYQKFLASLKRKQQKPTTVCKPFELQTSKIALKKKRISEENSSMQRATGSGLSVKSQESLRLSRAVLGLLSTSLDSIPAKMTRAAQLRVSQTRLKQQKKTEKETAELREKHLKMLKEKELKQEVVKRSAAADVSSHSKDSAEILKRKKEGDRERSTNYRKQLNEMKKRIQERPLLFEQIAEKNARLAAERKYYATLSKSGLNVEYLNKRSSTDVLGSVLVPEAEELFINGEHSPGSPVKEDSPLASGRYSGPVSGASSRLSSRRMSEQSLAKSIDEEVKSIDEEVNEESDEEKEEQEEEERDKKEGEEEEAEYTQDFDGSENQSDEELKAENLLET